MGIISTLSKPFAAYVVKKERERASLPAFYQQKTFETLISKARNTQFGKCHGFNDIKSYDDFRKQVPIRDYEALKPYIQKIISGENDVLWPGKPQYLAKTSGTTSGVKYIPISKESISNHINGARNTLLSYINETGNSQFLNGKLIFLSGSPTLDTKGGIHFGRLSGIVNHHVPPYLRSNQMPSYSTNCIEDWEEKLEGIINETISKRITLISGIPPWVQMYFDRIIEKTGKPIKDVFPYFSVFVHGGVNFKPYQARLFESIGKKIDSIETYPASEGFIAYQDSQTKPGLLPLLDSGIWFEFILVEEYFNEKPTRISIDEVKLNKNYAVIINNNAGLWGYSLGDTVKFISKEPYRLVVTGRIKHFISAFGEHVIGEEVEKAISIACKAFPETEIVEFTVAPNVTPTEGLPRHEWYIEFAKKPKNPAAFSSVIDKELVKLNSYYDDLITGKILQSLEVINLKPASFRNYMKNEGKLGGQNKVPRLSNDRKMADKLLAFRA